MYVRCLLLLGQQSKHIMSEWSSSIERGYKMPNHSSVPIILGPRICLPPSRYLSGLSSACLVSFSGFIVELSGEEQGKSGPYPFTLARRATTTF